MIGLWQAPPRKVVTDLRELERMSRVREGTGATRMNTFAGSGGATDFASGPVGRARSHLSSKLNHRANFEGFEASARARAHLNHARLYNGAAVAQVSAVIELCYRRAASLRLFAIRANLAVYLMNC